MLTPHRILFTTATVLLATIRLPAQTTPSPPINGLAHIAISVQNVERSRDFYGRLGFEEAFHFGDDAAPTQSFIKINDRQFIELYPSSTKQPVGFLHLCFDGDDLDALYAFYVARGLSPKPVRKAHAGNLLFTMEGPEQQNIEYTQYLPGSLHSEDHGKHIGQHRLATGIVAVALAMHDPAAARAFYIDKLGFTSSTASPDRLCLPGSSGQYVLIDSASLVPHARLLLQSTDLATVATQLERLHIPPATQANNPSEKKAITITDPDGNLLVFLRDPSSTK